MYNIGLLLCHKKEVICIIINGVYVFGIIYKITNTANGKSYIGQTKHKRGFKGRYYHTGKNNVERVYYYHKRMKELGDYYNDYLLKSMEKYGLDHFEVCEVLDTANSQEELDEKEIYYIEKYDSFRNGYNATSGGNGNKGVAQPKGKDNELSMPICQLTLNGKFVKEWGSLGEIRRNTDYNVPNIVQTCRGINTKAYNFLWVYKKDYDPNKDYKWIAPNCYKTIVLLDNDNKILSEYHSVAECSRLLNIDRKTVRDSCNHIFNKPKYKLAYKDKYLEEQRLSGGTFQIEMMQ